MCSRAITRDVSFRAFRAYGNTTFFQTKKRRIHSLANLGARRRIARASLSVRSAPPQPRRVEVRDELRPSRTEWSRACRHAAFVPCAASGDFEASVSASARARLELGDAAANACHAAQRLRAHGSRGERHLKRAPVADQRGEPLQRPDVRDDGEVHLLDAKAASRAHTRTSQAAARSTPPPKHAPCTAHTTARDTAQPP